MRTTVRLTASATSALPRWLLFAICIVYAASGLFGRDPWKNEDAAAFGVMWTMANGGWHDWLLPNLVGKVITATGPMPFWLGAIFIRTLGPWLAPNDAAHVLTGLMFSGTCAFVWYGTYLLGRRPEVQPFKYAFGGEPSPRDYGRTLADGALLILLASFGLAERGHESTPQIAQLACAAMFLYGLVRALDKPWQGACWTGSALGIFLLCANPPLLLGLFVALIAVTLVIRELDTRKLLLVAIPLGLVISVSWPLAAHLAYPDDAASFLRDWVSSNFANFRGSPKGALFYAAKNLPLFTWPAWPLAIWTWVSWPDLRRAPHIAIPLSLVVPMLLLILLQQHETNLLFLLLLPPLAVMASFGLPTLKREAINAFDWFAVLSFTILGGFVWVVWIASQTGQPAPIARNLSRLVPGFKPEFNVLSLVAALIVTGCWIALVRWRLSRHPKVLWRSVVLSSAGTTLMWVLLMTLWLPLVNFSRTYRDVATQIATRLPSDYTCITPVRLGDAQLASFAYFGNMHFSFNDADCDVLLRQDTQDYNPPASLSAYTWKLVWEGRRPADRDERFRLYVRVERPTRPVTPTGRRKSSR